MWSAMRMVAWMVQPGYVYMLILKLSVSLAIVSLCFSIVFL
jgi:hypothetical protein